MNFSDINFNFSRFQVYEFVSDDLILLAKFWLFLFFVFFSLSNLLYFRIQWGLFNAFYSPIKGLKICIDKYYIYFLYKWGPFFYLGALGNYITCLYCSVGPESRVEKVRQKVWTRVKIIRTRVTCTWAYNIISMLGQ